MNKEERRQYYAENRSLMQQVRHSAKTGRCIVCGEPVAFWQDSGAQRVTCGKPKCFASWLNIRESDLVSEADEVDQSEEGELPEFMPVSASKLNTIDDLPDFFPVFPG